MARTKNAQAGRWAKRRQQWRERLTAWSGSGQTQAAFCRAHGLDQNAFSSWKRRLGIETPVAAAARSASVSAQLAEAGLFVPVTVRPSTNGVAPVFEIVLRNGRVLRAGLDAEPGLLTRWATALEG